MTTLTVGRTTYTVSPCDGTELLAYELLGPRGSRYHLLRNKHNPHRLFAVNGRDFTKGTPFEGRWFADDNGTLRIL
jgi:hypothetical protein